LANAAHSLLAHGNASNPGNVRVTADRVALIDWDESHVDAPDFDLVLPYNAAGLDDDARDVAAQASAAWEAAVCWDDEYAVERLTDSHFQRLIWLFQRPAWAFRSSGQISESESCRRGTEARLPGCD
jgi:aminoglycoside phosphotransferase (APT) family kinase protein